MKQAGFERHRLIRLVSSWRRKCIVSLHLVVACLMSFGSLPPAAYAGAGSPACRDLFDIKITPREALTARIEEMALSARDPKIAKFLNKSGDKAALGLAEVRELTRLTLAQEAKKENSQLSRSKRLYKDYIAANSPAAILDSYIRRQVIKRGFIRALEEFGLFKEPGRKERFRQFIAEYRVSSLLAQTLLAFPAVAFAGPQALPLVAISSRLPWLESKRWAPGELEGLLDRAIENGIDEELHREFELRLGTRAQAAAAHEWLRSAVMIFFLVTLYQFIDEEGALFGLVLRSALLPPTAADVARERERVGLDGRVEFQTKNWQQGYRVLFGREPTAAETEQKAAEIRRVLSNIHEP